MVTATTGDLQACNCNVNMKLDTPRRDSTRPELR